MHKSQILSAHSHEFIISHYACSECIKELFIWHCAPSETTEPQIESSSSQIESTIVIQSRFKSNHHLELPMTTVTGGQGLTLHAKGQISRLYGSKVSKCLFLCLQHRCTLWRDYPLTIRKHCYTYGSRKYAQSFENCARRFCRFCTSYEHFLCWHLPIKLFEKSVILLHCALSCGALYSVIAPVCLCVCVCLWVLYHDNSKLRASIFTKLGL